MGHSIAKLATHIVFSTKRREPWLECRESRGRLFGFMATILASNVDTPTIKINGVADHVHVLCLMSRKFPLMDILQEMKKETSKWLKREIREPDFCWQVGYGAFSVSESLIPDTVRYIERQEEHHQHVTFKDEFRALCSEREIALDEQYAWD